MKSGEKKRQEGESKWLQLSSFSVVPEVRVNSRGFAGKRAQYFLIHSRSHALMFLPFIVATNTKRYEQRLQSDPTEQSQMKALSQLLNCEM